MDTCVLLTSGGVECWGDNNHGQLGDGTTADSLIPRPVKGITTATAVAFGESSWLCAAGQRRGQVLGTELLWPTGQWHHDQIPHVPVAVTGISSATAVAASCCAQLCAAGQRRGPMLGMEQRWPVGRWNERDSSIPVSVTGISTATAVAAGSSHSCALLASGAVQCWGYNVYRPVGQWHHDRFQYAGHRRRDQQCHGSRGRVRISVVRYLPAVRSSAGDATATGELGDGSVRGFKHPGVCRRDQHGRCDHRRWHIMRVPY